VVQETLAVSQAGRSAQRAASVVEGAQVVAPWLMSGVAKAAIQRKRLTSMLDSEEITGGREETSRASYAF